MSSRVDRVQRRATTRIDPRAELDAEAEGIPALEIPAPAESGAARLGPPDETEAAPASGVTSADRRLADLDPLLAGGAWREIMSVLGPPEQVDKLPPTLALIYAVAQRESAGNTSATPANELAIRAVASIYGIAPGSTTALVLAKRLLRQNPAAWRTKPAPPARLSFLIIALALAFGLGAGWWFSAGSHHLF